MTYLHNHDQILEFLWKILPKGFQINQNYLCALRLFLSKSIKSFNEKMNTFLVCTYCTWVERDTFLTCIHVMPRGIHISERTQRADPLTMIREYTPLHHSLKRWMEISVFSINLSIVLNSSSMQYSLVYCQFGLDPFGLYYPFLFIIVCPKTLIFPALN